MKKIQFLLLLLSIAIAACKNNDENGQAKTSEAQTTTNTTQPQVTQIPDPTAANSTSVPSGPLTTIQFENTEYDYGVIKEGDVVEYEFKFKNTGKEPLIITDARGSCGCTVPDWNKNPIPPGASDVIKVRFDSKGKGTQDGQVQTKRVTITANTDPVNTYLTIKGVVKK